MADLSSSRSPGDLRLADGVGGEVVLMDISLLGDVGIETLDALGIGERCQCADVHDLGLPSREHGAAVDPRDQADLRVERADLGQGSAVRSLVVLQDHLADGLLLILVDCIGELLKVGVVSGKGLLQALGDLCDIGLPRLLVVGEDSGLHLLLGDDLLHVLEHLCRDGDGLVGLLLFADLCADLVDERDELLVDGISSIDVLHHVRLRHLVGACLDHHDLVGGGGDGEL